MRQCRRICITLAACVLFAVVPLSDQHVAMAASYTLVWDGSCNYSVPHAWAGTNWVGQPTTSDGDVHGQLVQRTDQGDKVRLDRSAAINSQGTGNADVDMNWGYTSTGGWYEQSWHWATFFSGVTYKSKGISCP